MVIMSLNPAAKSSLFATLAKAKVQVASLRRCLRLWIPIFVEMTVVRGRHSNG